MIFFLTEAESTSASKPLQKPDLYIPTLTGFLLLAVILAIHRRLSRTWLTKRGLYLLSFTRAGVHDVTSRHQFTSWFCTTPFHTSGSLRRTYCCYYFLFPLTRLGFQCVRWHADQWCMDDKRRRTIFVYLMRKVIQRRSRNMWMHPITRTFFSHSVWVAMYDN